MRFLRLIADRRVTGLADAEAARAAFYKRQLDSVLRQFNDLKALCEAQESDLRSAVSEVAQLQGEISRLQADIRVAEAENRRLWEMDQRFLARVKSEIALAHRATAEAAALVGDEADE